MSSSALEDRTPKEKQKSKIVDIKLSKEKQKDYSGYAKQAVKVGKTAWKALQDS